MDYNEKNTERHEALLKSHTCSVTHCIEGDAS